MKEIVTIYLSGKKYGVEVCQMQGIENFTEMTLAPDMPDCMQGVITVRKETIPVVDIKKQFVLPAAEITQNTKYLVLRTSQGKMAVVADGVAKILKVEEEDVQDFPAIVQTKATSYVKFIVKSEGQLILVINTDAILSAEDWGAIQKVLEDMETGGNDD